MAPTTDTPADISPEQSPGAADRVCLRRVPATLLGAALAVAALAALAVALLDATRPVGPEPGPPPAVAGPPDVFRDVPPLEDSVPFVPVAPLPADRSVPLSAVQVQQLMVEAGFPHAEIGTGVAIALAESERVPDAVNPYARVGADRGLWQINDHFWAPELGAVDWREPAANTRVALEVWHRQGWTAWATYDPDTMDRMPPPGPGSLPR